MKDYNGFSGSERMIVQKIMDELQRRGIINWIDQPCEICTCEHSIMHSHCEDYSNPFDFHVLCIECHMKLHMRFRYPGYWIKHLLDVKNGYVCPIYLTNRDYYKAPKLRFKYPEFEHIDPKTIGNEWFHRLKLTPINKNKFKCYNDEQVRIIIKPTDLKS